MQDKAALNISEELRLFLESMVEEVILERSSFENHNKYLRRYLEAEGVDYNQFVLNLSEFLETADELTTQESKANERLVRMLGKECYISENKLEKLISAINKKRSEAEAKRRAEEESERKVKEAVRRKEKKEAERKLREETMRRDQEEKERKAREIAEIRYKIEIKETDEKYFFIVRGVSFQMIKVKGGRFEMGASKKDGNASSNEKPMHWVTLSDYSIGETVVTQELWEAVMGNNPSFSQWRDYPVTNVSRDDCMSFINELNQLTGKQFRLPTEAEWEYAARGGNKSQGFLYSGSNDINAVGWCGAHGVGSVARFNPNELGIFDMSGNVWELCQDKYEKYSSKEQYNPVVSQITRGLYVSRGGCYCSNWLDCRLTCRRSEFGYPSQLLGFRLVLWL